jgi:hypothetical protein
MALHHAAVRQLARIGSQGDPGRGTVTELFFYFPHHGFGSSLAKLDASAKEGPFFSGRRDAAAVLQQDPMIGVIEDHERHSAVGRARSICHMRY